MKIQPTQRPISTTSGGKARKSSEAGSFSALLRTRMEGIQSTADATEQNGGGDAQLWDLVEEGARLLDRALAQIEADGGPDAEVVEQLQQLQQALHGSAAGNDKLHEVDALLAAESQRLGQF